MLCFGNILNYNRENRKEAAENIVHIKCTRMQDITSQFRKIVHRNKFRFKCCSDMGIEHRAAVVHSSILCGTGELEYLIVL